MRRALLSLGTAALLCAPAGRLWAADAAPGYDPRAAFAETDTNHDGTIDHEEFIERVTEVFFQADRNKDGSLDVVEVQSAMVQTENLNTADSNHDGKITLHEFQRARLKDFDAADTNADGLLSVDEVVNAYQKAGK